MTSFTEDLGVFFEQGIEGDVDLRCEEIRRSGVDREAEHFKRAVVYCAAALTEIHVSGFFLFSFLIIILLTSESLFIMSVWV